jgi:tetratricopeptide (TPR) repeat protein
MRTAKTILSLACLMALAAPASAGQIMFKDGTALNGVTVKNAGTDEVSFARGGSTQKRPSHEIEIIFPTFDRTLKRGIEALRGGDMPKAIKYFKQVLKGRKANAHAFAQFFLAEAYSASGNGAGALAAYDKCASKFSSHFCAPLSLVKAAGMSSGSQSLARYEKLASGSFGAAWAHIGNYGKALALLNKGQHSQARSIFAKLSGSAKDPTTRQLSSCARAHCDFLAGKKSDAERTFKSISSDPKAPGAARGYAWTGIGLCLKGNKDDEALLAFLRGLLLYPSNPQRYLAGKEAGKISKAKGLGGDRRLAQLGRSPLPFGDYTGSAEVGELMRRTLSHASAQIVQEFAPKLLKNAKTDAEKADLEYVAADAMKVVARSTGDTDMLTAYEKKLEGLQKKYPNHGRSNLAGINQIEAGKARALATLTQASQAEKKEDRATLTNKARQILKDLISSCKKTVSKEHELVKTLQEKEAEFKTSALIPAELQQKRQRGENKRDLTQFFMADAYTTLAGTYEEDSAESKAELQNAKAAYGTLVDGNDDRAGTSNDVLRNLGYIGQVETMVAVGDTENAIGLATDLTFIELWYDPSRVPASYKPQVPKDQQHIKQICINAHILLVKALVKDGKGEEALKAALGIDNKPNGKGWRKHPLGLQLVFERAKAMAGAGQGERGAREIFRMLKTAQTQAEAGDEAAQRRFVDTCKVLSEISDVTGGEVYEPEVQFYVGYGYFCRGKSELSVAGYKGVLTAARTPQERVEWVPKAVREIGNRLFQQERFLEAALAYQTVFTEFPDHSLAKDAVRFSISAMKRAIDQFGETDPNGALNKFYKQLKRSAERAAGAELQAKNTMNDATTAQKRQDWVKAAQTYLEVPATATDKKTKKTTKISYYPNAIANAGYCYSQAFKKSKDKKYLKLAQENLRKATKVGAEYGDRESQALACYYLGELELNLRKDPNAALMALKPFDGPLGSTGRAVRARYLQAMASLKKGGPGAGSKAEAFFNKVKDRTTDDFFPTFAYSMAARLRSFGAKRFKADPSDVNVPRAWRKKAARYAKLYLDASDASKVREQVYFYLADVLFEGGLYEDAKKAYDHCLSSYSEPKVSKKLDKKQRRALARYDGARLYRAFAAAQTGDAEAAITALEEVRSIVYLKNRDGKIVGRGLFKGRKLSGKTFKFRTPDGRTRDMKVWFTTIDSYGEELKFYDARPARSDDRFKVLLGSDPTKGYQKSDVLSLELTFKRDYFAVTALFNAMWAKYEATKDKNLLAKKGGVTAAINELRYVLRGMDEGSYASIAAQSQLEPLDFKVLKWSADVTYLKIKMARESWREVLNDIDMMIKLKRIDKAPESVKAQIMEIKAQAEAKK